MFGLTQLLDMDVAAFAGDVLDRDFLHVRGAADRYRDLFDTTLYRRAVDSILDSRTNPLGGRIDAAFRADGRMREVVVGDAKSFDAFVALGATIVAHNAPLVSAGVRRLMGEIKRRLGLGGIPRLAAFASPDGGGFNVHFDPLHVFVLQIAGRKRWKLWRRPGMDGPLGRYIVQPGAAPITDMPAWAQALVVPPDDTTAFEVVLEPGDALYVPPGHWHEARAEGDSLALSLGVTKLPFVAMLVERLRTELQQEAAWRLNLPAAAPAGRELPPPVRRFVDERLAELRTWVGDLEADDFADAWRAAVDDLPFAT